MYFYEEEKESEKKITQQITNNCANRMHPHGWCTNQNELVYTCNRFKDHRFERSGRFKEIFGEIKVV